MIETNPVMRLLRRERARLWDLAVVVGFALVAFAYFVPADIDGRILYRHDSSAGRGAGQEAAAYHAATGEVSRWTGSTFSGMPTYQTSPSYQSTDTLGAVMNAYHLWLPENVWYVFVYLLGFYILLRAFDFRRSLAALGAVVWAFSSYFFIIIAAGHIWKVMALAYLPPMIAGVVMAYRGRYLGGLLLTALFTAFEVKANHVQMTYYYLAIILFMVLAFLWQAVRERQMRRFARATAVCAAGAALGICINLSNIYHTWQYGKESMRSGSELVKKNAANQTASGLDRDYITQWSYGVDETWTLLVPNAKGGASMPLTQSEKAMEHAAPEYMQIYQQLGQYWGDQPGTSGPVYVGAFVLMLFVLGIFIVRGPMKWALLAATVLSVLLSWGRNFMPLTDFFLDYVPLYAKFRTVASILVIAEFTIPLLAMMALREIVEDPTVLTRRRRWLILSLALTAGAALLMTVWPCLFFSGFVSAQEQAAMQNIPAEYRLPLMANLEEMRRAALTADCWRTVLIIAVGTACLLLYRAKRLKAEYMIGAVTLLCLVDMWTVNKRYLYDDMFVEKSVREAPQPMTATDRQILQDKSLDYRVLNLATNTFNENETSYYHKSIGGYHAAKLRRYQEIITAYISPEMQRMMPAISEAGGDMTRVDGERMWPVLNMLNAKYIILPLEGGQTVPIQNPYAYGNAWMADRISYVANANDELDGVGRIDLRHEAVADKRYEAVLGKATPQTGRSQVSITAYQPNQLSYDVETDRGGILVFSEIYYPGWTATIDGQAAELGRVDYILRALRVSPGHHTVTLTFRPQSIQATETAAYIAYALLILALAGGIWVKLRVRSEE